MPTGAWMLTRRGVLRLVAALPLALAGARYAGAACRPTPAQSRGPYYPPGPIPVRTDLIATGRKPAGEAIRVSGRVLGTDCRPLAGARVEIWQADSAGRYAHPRDPSAAQGLEPAFRYYGAAVTGADGRYAFRTLLPGAYGSGGGRRPPHIHFQVAHATHRTLVTQLYFAGTPHRADDFLYRAVPPDRRAAVEAALETAQAGDGSREATFEIVLEPA